MDLHAFCKGSLWMCMHFALDPNEFACIVQFLWVLMHSVRDPYGFACVLLWVPMDLHACCQGPLWMCRGFARIPYACACSLLRDHYGCALDVNAFCYIGIPVYLRRFC